MTAITEEMERPIVIIKCAVGVQKDLDVKDNVDHRPWWDAWALCNGFKKNGERCNKPMMKGYEIEPGNLFIPLTCVLHLDQYKKVKKGLYEKDL